MQAIHDRVPEELIRQAIKDGATDPSLGSEQQWIAVTEYINDRGIDPWPARRAQLALNSVPLTELLKWLATDVLVAAPLMEAFTSHDTSIEHAVVRVPPAEVGAMASWFGRNTGSEVSVVDAEV